MNYINLNIADIKLQILFKDKKIEEYINDEFKYFILNNCEFYDNLDIKIKIFSKKFNLDIKEIPNRKNIFLCQEGMYAQKIKAKDHTTWITYKNQFKEICIYIDYDINDYAYQQLINPNFFSKWRSCLIDFFHGPFLGIMEIFLLKHQKSFIHASAFEYIKGNVFILAGAGQSGKSSVVKIANERRQYNVLSEDFCIIDLNSNFIGYPKQSRIRREDFIKSEKYLNYSSKLKLFEKVNYMLFKMFKFSGIIPQRRLNFDQIFKNNNLNLNSKTKKILIINRECTENRIHKISNSEFVNIIKNIMMIEFNNLPGFFELYEIINPIQKQDFEKMIMNFYSQVYSEKICYKLDIPYFKNESIYSEEVLKIIDKIK